jgi:hypothetical protein
MEEFIIKYWLQFLLGLLTMGITFWVKHYSSWVLKKRAEDKEKFVQEIIDKMKIEMEEENARFRKESEEADFSIEEEISTMNKTVESLKQGVLSIQGKQFKDNCRRLLEQGHEITLDEYRMCCEEHDIYNKLSGNHDGDTLFNLVSKKAEKLLGGN